MSAADEPAPGPSRPELAAVEAPDSPKARARALRKQLAANKSLDLLVPGYAGLLGVRYHPIAEDDWKAMARRLETAAGDLRTDETSAMDVATDIVIAACEGIIWRDAPDQEWEIVTDDDDVPLRFDQRLGDWLGFEAQSARECVREVFSPEGTKPISPGVHGDALAEWQRGNEQAINRSLLGK